MSHVNVNSIIDYYPNGTYKLTKKGDEKIDTLKKGFSSMGVATKNIESLYKKGYLNNQTPSSISIEKFKNYQKNNKYIILLLFLILFLIIII